MADACDVAMMWICWGQLALASYLVASVAVMWLQCRQDFLDW
jgi:hypothetical protein